MKLMQDLAGCLLLLGLAASPALTANISNINFNNTSAPNISSSTGGRFVSYATSGSAGGLSISGNSSDFTYSFQSQFRFASALRVPAGGPDFANILLTYPSYEVRFQVDDPTNIGYELTIDSMLRGILTASYEGFTGSANDSDFGVSVFGANFQAFIDTGSGFGPIVAALSWPAQSVSATADNSTASLIVGGSKSINLGSFSGTQEFGIRLSYNPSPTTTHISSNYVLSTTTARFGVDLGSEIGAAAYPGPDGEPASDHGHFLTIGARFQPTGEPDPGQIPEPSTYALLGAGLIGMGLLRRR